MKNKTKKSSSFFTRKLILLTLVVSCFYTAIQHFGIASYMGFGVSMLFAAPLSVFNTGAALQPIFDYIPRVVIVIGPALIIGFIFALLKYPRAFRVAFLSSLVAYLLAVFLGLVVFFFPLPQFIIYFVAMCIAYPLAVLIAKGVPRPLVFWGVVVAFVLFNLLAAPLLLDSISRAITERQSARELSVDLEDLKFTPFYPTYTPEGLATTNARLKGGGDRPYQHLHLSYSIGKVAVRVSEKLKNQETVFNKTDNCDASSIWFEMDRKDTIEQSRVDASRDNLSPCRVLGKTKGGHDVYVNASKSQFQFFYAEIDGIMIVMQIDSLKKPRYSDDFGQEILRIYDSMRPLENSEIKAAH